MLPIRGRFLHYISCVPENVKEKQRNWVTPKAAKQNKNNRGVVCRELCNMELWHATKADL